MAVDRYRRKGDALPDLFWRPASMEPSRPRPARAYCRAFSKNARLGETMPVRHSVRSTSRLLWSAPSPPTMHAMSRQAWVQVAIGGPCACAICARYPDQFVCLIDVVPVERWSPGIASGRIVGNGPSRRDAFAPTADDIAGGGGAAMSWGVRLAGRASGFVRKGQSLERLLFEIRLHLHVAASLS